MRTPILALLLVTACAAAPPPPVPRPTLRDRAAEAAKDAQLRSDLGDFRAAVEFQRFAVAADPARSEGWFRLAEIYHNAGFPRHGVWVLRAFVRRFPSHAWHVEAERLAAEWAVKTTCTAIGDEPEDEPPGFATFPTPGEGARP